MHNDTHTINIDRIVKLFTPHISGKLFVSDNIPAKKLENARHEFSISRLSNVHLLIDSSMWGTCKTGFAITDDGLTWNNSEPEGYYSIGSVEWDSLIHKNLKKIGLSKILIGGSFSKHYDVSMANISRNDLFKIIQTIQEYVTEDILSPEKQRINPTYTSTPISKVEPKNVPESSQSKNLIQNSTTPLSLEEKINEINRLYASIGRKPFGNSVYLGSDKSINSVLSNATKNIFPSMSPTETLLLLYDDTILFSGKKGFAISNENLYYSNGSTPSKISIHDIKSATCAPMFVLSIKINDKTELDVTQISTSKAKKLVQFIMQIITILKS